MHALLVWQVFTLDCDGDYCRWLFGRAILKAVGEFLSKRAQEPPAARTPEALGRVFSTRTEETFAGMVDGLSSADRGRAAKYSISIEANIAEGWGDAARLMTAPYGHAREPLIAGSALEYVLKPSLERGDVLEGRPSS
jgi:hypothetical protein